MELDPVNNPWGITKHEVMTLSARELYLLAAERNKSMIERLKNLQIERMDLDDAVGLAAFGRAVELEYSQVGAEAPDWLTDNLKELRKEIRNRLQDTLERQFSEATSRLEALATVDEKRDKLRANIEVLKAKLGK